jgi:hypothetical protein
MSHLFLSHLSKNNNCPELVKNLFEQHADGVKMIIASRFEETAVYQIQENASISTSSDLNWVQPQLEFSF